VHQLRAMVWAMGFGRHCWRRLLISKLTKADTMSQLRLPYQAIDSEQTAADAALGKALTALEAMLATRGIYDGTAASALAKFIFMVTRGDELPLQRKLADIAADPFIRKQFGKKPSTRTLSRAAARLEEDGLLNRGVVIGRGKGKEKASYGLRDWVYTEVVLMLVDERNDAEDRSSGSFTNRFSQKTSTTTDTTNQNVLLPPIPPTTPTTPKHENNHADWEAAAAEVAGEIAAWSEAIDKAKQNGLTPAAVSAVVAHYRAHRSDYEAKDLYWRLLRGHRNWQAGYWPQVSGGQPRRRRRDPATVRVQVESQVCRVAKRDGWFDDSERVAAMIERVLAKELGQPQTSEAGR